MSTFKVEIVPVELKSHPNADSLSIVEVWGYQVVVRTDEWAGIEQGAYIPPESLVPDKPEYAFLAAHPEQGLREKDRRIKARRFRKEWSFGLLVKAPDGSQIGDDVAEFLGITHYEPPMKPMSRGYGQKMWKLSDQAHPPKHPGPFYDIENWRRYPHIFEPGEEVIITEKVHGCNARITFQDGKFHVASRKFYRTEFVRKPARGLWANIKALWWDRFSPEKNQIESPEVYWRAFRQYPDLMDLVKMCPDYVFYGEIYGPIQEGFPYDSEGKLKFRLFDIYGGVAGEFVTERFKKVFIAPDEFPWVPVDYIGPYSPEIVEEICQRPSQMASHMREGCVIRPAVERFNPEIGRVILKAVNPAYLEKL